MEKKHYIVKSVKVAASEQTVQSLQPRHPQYTQHTCLRCGTPVEASQRLCTTCDVASEADTQASSLMPSGQPPTRERQVGLLRVFPDRVEVTFEGKVEERETLRLSSISAVLKMVIKGQPSHALMIVTKDGKKIVYRLAIGTGQAYHAILSAQRKHTLQWTSPRVGEPSSVARTVQNEDRYSGARKTAVAMTGLIMGLPCVASDPLFKYHRFGFDFRVYPDRVEASTVNKPPEVIPLRRIATVELSRGLQKLVITTRDGRKAEYQLGRDNSVAQVAIQYAIALRAGSVKAEPHQRRVNEDRYAGARKTAAAMTGLIMGLPCVASDPLFKYHRFGFDFRVYPDRVEASTVNKPPEVIPLRRIATVEVRRGLLRTLLLPGKLVITTRDRQKAEYQLGRDNSVAQVAIQYAIRASNDTVKGTEQAEGEQRATLRDVLAKELRTSRCGWFTAIAGYSLLNSILVLLLTGWAIAPTGMVATQYIDGFATGYAQLNGPEIKYGAFVLDLVLIGIFFAIGRMAAKGSRGAYITGMVLYMLDTGLLLLMALMALMMPLMLKVRPDLLVLYLVFHVLTLFGLYGGLRVAGKLGSVRTQPLAGVEAEHRVSSPTSKRLDKGYR